ncbi:MAG TPA: CAP domain-containing protein, partial [Polyangiales bacterium]|nr:CAP domain-containing protein [Polyangiales bacterium]
GQPGVAGSPGVAGAPAGLAGMAAAGRGGGAAGMMGMPRAGRSGGAAGAAPPAMPVTNPSMCPAAAADATPGAVAALGIVNTVRIAAGAGCVNLVNTISNGATAHCLYYAMYMEGDMCISNPHGEVMSCAGFTGASPGARSKAAGYTLGGGGEIMAFFNDPQRAVDIWVNSVWHRTPLLDPSTGDMGYGAAPRCDVIDFGRGVMAPATALVVYPYDGQVNVPTSFNGANEGPMPPAPTTGWPSASPISVHAKGLMITEHVLTIDGNATPIDHVWLDANASIVAMDMRSQLKSVNFMYANAPFTANTKYRVKLTGTYSGGMLSKEWTFTTGAASRRF